MKKLLLAGATMLAISTASLATNVGMTGLGEPFDNMQPSLVITQVLPMSGIFPRRDGDFATGDTLGFVYSFAGNFTPGNSQWAQGQLLPIVQNTALFSLLGTTYGGDGRTTYRLPNLAGTAVMGIGQGPGLSLQSLGNPTGSPTSSLGVANLPAHNHTLPGGGATGSTGGGQAFSNTQASLPMKVVIATSGIFPSPDGGGGSAAFLGQIGTFAGNFVPGGWAEADGSLLQISQNEALFSIIGTTYGGDGQTTFALPDLRGRLAVGASSANPLGSMFGVEATNLNITQLPAHEHTVAGGGNTGTTGGSQAVNNIQPSLAINYLISLLGLFPSLDSGAGFDPDIPTLGQIVEFAGNFAPRGWALAHGQLLPISQNQALFALLGTMYGGDGRTTFALPDFRGRTAIGSGGDFDVGERFGSDTNLLTVANLAAHDHTTPDANQVPEPGALALLFAGLAGLGLIRRKRA